MPESLTALCLPLQISSPCKLPSTLVSALSILGNPLGPYILVSSWRKPSWVLKKPGENWHLRDETWVVQGKGSQGISKTSWKTWLSGSQPGGPVTRRVEGGLPSAFMGICKPLAVLPSLSQKLDLPRFANIMAPVPFFFTESECQASKVYKGW